MILYFVEAYSLYFCYSTFTQVSQVEQLPYSIPLGTEYLSITTQGQKLVLLEEKTRG